MANRPDFYGDGQFCLSGCDRDQSTHQPRKVQGRQRQPMNHSEMRETEDLIASEMSKLSVQERLKAMDDVHCVGEELKETPEITEQSLREFDQLVHSSANRAYAIAVKQNQSYVEDRSLRLKFLRANMFNIKKSVIHMMNFLQQKSVYFGEEKIAQDIGPKDMNREEVALMKSGFFQVLKDRDRNGRAILYNSSFDRMPRECKIETLIRVLYHIIFNMMLSTIPSIQTKGAVMIYYDESKGNENVKLPGMAFRMKAHHFFDSLPWRISSLHICIFSSPGNFTFHNKLIQAALKASSELALTRSRLHYGSDMERQYELRSFGIPLENFPVDKNGDIRTSALNWCDDYFRVGIDQQARSEFAASRKVSNGVLETDVLFGRGRSVHHAGNIRFRKFLEEYAADYDKLPRNQRKKACIEYTKMLLLTGTRFLRQTGNEEWVVCEFDQVVDKVAQFFRTRRRDKGRFEPS